MIFGSKFKILCDYTVFEELIMPRGDKSSYTEKQKRQAKHIEESEKERGLSEEDAERIAWATVNKQDGGGKKKRHH
ncbi:hypothetical protein B9T38_13900 [Acinetobacter sp. ANC 4218]|jgi:ABC-type uncharacterized transport system ATPase subunit|nr:hypothetical protein B9T38_13900 [Acinetobacter sp. ANC 4218]